MINPSEEWRKWVREKFDAHEEILSGGIQEVVQDKSDFEVLEKKIKKLETKLNKLIAKLKG